MILYEFIIYLLNNLIINIKLNNVFSKIKKLWKFKRMLRYCLKLIYKMSNSMIFKIYMTFITRENKPSTN